jgi:hypothetical protein
MAKILYQAWNPGVSALETVDQAEEICTDYAAQGYDLTLRQLYYQFVSRALIPNTMQSYKRLGDIINKARLAGLLDWDSIVDRTRNLRSNSHWRTPADIIRSAAQSFAIDKWSNQDARVEVWVEKEALAGIVSQVAERHDCAWFSCRGYVSQSEVWAAAQRHLRYIENGQRVVVVHLGDHDPSGIDMTRDITDRLEMFVYTDWAADRMDEEYNADDLTRWEIKEHVCEHLGSDVCDGHDPIEIRRIALNMGQVLTYNPPPNPAKLTDSRASDYIARYGPDSWELDALDPATLDALIETAITREMDPDRYTERRGVEDGHRAVLTAASRRWSEVAGMLNGSA